jgi:hypothetical protein
VRYQAAVILNLLIPGTGLIVTRREWLGASLAGLFGLIVQLGLWGCLIEPSRMPSWLVATCLGGGALVWLAAQYLLRQRLILMRNPEVARELGRLRDQAAERVAEGNYQQAWAALQLAVAIDDEDLATNVQVADLLAILGRFSEARQAWQRVSRLDRQGQYGARMIEALDRLPDR